MNVPTEPRFRRLADGILCAVALLLLASCGDDASTADPPFSFEALGRPEIVVGDGAFGFTEGPVWNPDEGVLYFSDLARSAVFRLTTNGTFGGVPLPREPSDAMVTVGQANGLRFDQEGRLLLADQGNRRVVRRDPFGLTILADRFQGRALNSPNDLVVRSDGTIYFTDPDFGFSTPELDHQGIYRITPSGELTLEADDDGAPNGVALSPDETVLYVASTFGGSVSAHDVAADGSLSNRRRFGIASLADGLCIDVQGTLFAAMDIGLRVFAPDGTILGDVPLDRAASNCGFGGPEGKTIYITAGNRIYAMDAPVRGR